MHWFRNEKGIALILVFVTMVVLSGVALAFLSIVNYEIGSSGAGLRNMQAFYIAEAGLAKARWALGEGDAGWSETDEAFGEGTYTATIANNGDDTYTITSDGYVPDSANPLAQRQVVESDIAVTSNLSLGATASASSVQGQNTADKAKDGDAGTKWKSNIKNGSWLKLDFGSSTTFDRIVIDGANIDSYAIEYSPDDVVPYQGVANIVELPAWTFSFDSVSARYLRLSVNGDRPEINELETYDIAGGGVNLGQGEFATSF